MCTLTGKTRYRHHTVKHWVGPDESFIILQVEEKGQFLGAYDYKTYETRWRDATMEDLTVTDDSPHVRHVI